MRNGDLASGFCDITSKKLHASRKFTTYWNMYKLVLYIDMKKMKILTYQYNYCSIYGNMAVNVTSFYPDILCSPVL